MTAAHALVAAQTSNLVVVGTVKQPELGEECDTQTATETCDADCTRHAVVMAS